MRFAFIIGTNDVGGAEYVSYQHVLMAHRNNLDMVVLSGTTGKFYDLLIAAGVKIDVIGLTPSEKFLEPFLSGCDVVFNCNFFGLLPIMARLREKLGFSTLLILHNDTNWLCSQVKKFDGSIDLYYSIHQRIVDAFVSMGASRAEKFVVIPNCVDSELVNSCHVDPDQLKKLFGLSPRHFVIGMVTRVAGDKNILDALRILKSLPVAMDARLLIVGGTAANQGSITYHAKVRDTIKRDPFLKSRVIITGNQEMREVYRLISCFDIGLNCSPSEGLPIAMLEMMAAGVTCVMPSIGDIPDVLGGNGVVVPIRQRKETSEIWTIPCYTTQEIRLFADAITNLYKNKTICHNLGLSASEFIEQNRSLQVQEKQFLNFLDMGTKKISRIPNRSALGTNDTNGMMKIGKDGLTGENKELPKVSVLMPTRDGNLTWMKQAIESILAQDYKGEMELVIVSHDCRLSMIGHIDKIIADNQSGVTIVHKTIGDDQVTFSEVLDFGVKSCNGEIIVRMDHDDVADPSLVSSEVIFLLSHPEIHVCGVQLNFFDGKEMTTRHPGIVTKEIAANSNAWWFVNHPGVAMRKETLQKIGGYGHTANGYAEDYALWCKYLREGYVIANLPDVLMNYRVYNKRTRPSDFITFLEKEKASLRK